MGAMSPLKEAPSGASGKQAFDPDQAQMCLVVVRTDLTLPQQMVQACHASSQAGGQLGSCGPELRMALLAVDSQVALIEAAARLERLGIRFSLFEEPDWGIGFSALASEPIPWRQARRALPRLPLWGAPKCECLSTGTLSAEVDILPLRDIVAS